MTSAVNYLFESINISFTLVILVLLRKKFNLDDRSFLLLFAHLVLIFLTNYVLFPPSYMSDQFSYLFSSQHIRGDALAPFHNAFRVQFASFFFAASPIPLINSVYSIALVNYLLYLTLYLFLRERRVLTRSNELFYFLYPSLALYTSVGLRDMLIFFLMALLIYYIFVGNKIIIPGLFFGIPLLILKLQNFFVILAASVLFIILHKKYHLLIKIIIISSILFIFYNFQSMFSLNNINKIRFLFYLENNSSFLGFQTFSSWTDAFITSVTSIFTYLFEPFIWKAKNPLNFMQSIENIVIFIIIIRIILKSKNSIFKTERVSLFFFLIIGLLIYSMVIINPGTAARYRYSFIGIFIIFYNFFTTKDIFFKISSSLSSRAIRISQSL